MTDNWKPIETAPKDGEIILLSQPSKSMGSGWWDEEKQCWQSVVESVEGMCTYYPDFLPTFWLPYPKPPNSTVKKDD